MGGSVIAERFPQPLVLPTLELDQLGHRPAAGLLNRTSRPLGGTGSPLLHLSFWGGLGSGFRGGFDSRIRGGGRRRGFGADDRRKSKGNNDREQGGKADHESFWLHRERVPALCDRQGHCKIAGGFLPPARSA